MRRPLIAGNWKMNFTNSEAIAFVEELLTASYDEEVEKLICVPSVHLSDLKKLTKTSSMKLGAQNMYFEDSGAFTGEISPKMLEDIGVDYVIIGHSERRSIFGEDDRMIAKKIGAAFEKKIKPILCVGESLEEREDGRHKEKVRDQLQADLVGFDPEDIKDLVVAYEPIWAIGTGKTASKEDAIEMINYIRLVLGDLFGKDLAQTIRILYGGSVKPNNIVDFMESGEIDGALVGGASLNVQSFVSLVTY